MIAIPNEAEKWGAANTGHALTCSTQVSSASRVSTQGGTGRVTEFSNVISAASTNSLVSVQRMSYRSSPRTASTWNSRSDSTNLRWG